MIDTSLILWLGAFAAFAVGGFLVATSDGDGKALERGIWGALIVFVLVQLVWVVPILRLWHVRAQPWF